jgi:PAT family beta-lactamase induction signal transducer AmpG
MVKPLNLKAAVVEPFRDFLKRPCAILLLLFIVFYKVGDDFATALSTTFFLRELHFSLQVIGSVAKTVGLISAIVGTLIGGVLLPRLGLLMSLFLFGCLQMIATLFYLTSAIVGPHIQLLVATVIAENLTAGMATTAFLALLISLCHREYSATQFALFSALMSVGRVVVGPFAGMLVTCIGWIGLFVWALLMALPALFILMFLKHRVDFKELLGNN